MKKILVVLLVSLSAMNMSAQESVETTPTLSKYVCVGLSITNTQGASFDTTSYPSLEFGVCKDNVSLGLAVGRGNLRGLGKSTDVISNYYGELRLVPSFDLGMVNGSVILGVGSYYAHNTTFVEYGVGLSKTYGDLTFGVSYSNWDGGDYITPSISIGL